MVLRVTLLPYSLLQWWLQGKRQSVVHSPPGNKAETSPEATSSLSFYLCTILLPTLPYRFLLKTLPHYLSTNPHLRWGWSLEAEPEIKYTRRKPHYTGRTRAPLCWQGPSSSSDSYHGRFFSTKWQIISSSSVLLYTRKNIARQSGVFFFWLFV